MEENKKTKIFFIIFFTLIVASVVFTYYRYIVEKDFPFFTDENEIPALLDINNIQL
ncbi:MAG: hypothetical protein WCG28_03830 [bacterium]